MLGGQIRARCRETLHTREDPEQDVNSNYCSGIFRLQTSSVAGGGGAGGKPLQCGSTRDQCMTEPHLNAWFWVDGFYWPE